MNKIFGCFCGGLLVFRVVIEPDLMDSELTAVGWDCIEFSAAATVPLSETKIVTMIVCRSVVLRGISVFVLER